MKIIERNLTTKISLEVLNLLARNEQNYASPNHLKIILRIHTYHKKIRASAWMNMHVSNCSLALPFLHPFGHLSHLFGMQITLFICLFVRPLNQYKALIAPWFCLMLFIIILFVQNNLLRVFIRLLGQEQFTDVTVASEGRRIKCHKVIGKF